MSEEELTLEFVEELLQERESTVGRLPYKVPEQTSSYVRSVAQAGRCVYLDCGAPTYFKIKDKYHCTVHAIYYMGDLLDEKINHYSGRPPGMEQIMKAYERMENTPQTDFEERWLNMNAKGIVIERVDHQTLKIVVDGKVFTKSPYVDIEGVLLISLLEMLR